MADIAAAFYFDPSIQHNGRAYSLTPPRPLSSTHVESVLNSNISPNILNPDLSSLLIAEPSNSSAQNIFRILQKSPVIYTYSSTRDIVDQLFALSKALAASSLDPSYPASRNPAVFLLFFAIDSAQIEQYLPVLRFVSFLASHFPSVLTVLYDDDHSAAALAASRASSLSGPITKPNPHTSLSTTNAFENTSQTSILPQIDTSAHIYHTLKTCGVAVFSPLVLTDKTIDLTIAKAGLFPAAEAAVVSHINRSVETLSSNNNDCLDLPIACCSNKELGSFSAPSVQCDVIQQATPLFSRKFDYAIVNFITYLEMYHNCHLLDSDKLFTYQSSPSETSNSIPNSAVSPANSHQNNNSTFNTSCYPEIFHISQDRINLVASLVGSWDFLAHDLSYNDLLFAAFLMFKHAFSMHNTAPTTNTTDPCLTSNLPPTVADLIISDSALLKFLLVVRDSYRPSNPYHNYRHAIDVLQAAFFFLIQLNSLPQYDSSHVFKNDPSSPTFKSQVSILDPVESLTLLIIAIGHDVGHPGVTNMFLSTAKNPIAEAFSFKSILESYHSAAFQRILEMYWPATQANQVCRLIIRSVQATDMGLHFDYMKEAEKTFEMFHNRGATEYVTNLDRIIKQQELNGKATINPSTPFAPSSCPLQEKLDFQTLVSCLLIKCADISNVVRTLEISSKWGVVLTKEFSQVETLEIELKMKEPKPVATTEKQSSSPNPTIEVKEDGEGYTVPVLSLAKGQLFFINTFAKPLFELVSKLFPELAFTITILESNALVWKNKVDAIESLND